MTAASARSQDPAAAGIFPTTSSSCNLRTRPRPRSRGQPKDSDESLRIFLVITVAHGERRKIRAVERVLRLTADHRDISLIQPERHASGHLFLSALHKRIQ